MSNNRRGEPGHIWPKLLPPLAENSIPLAVRTTQPSTIHNIKQPLKVMDSVARKFEQETSKQTVSEEQSTQTEEGLVQYPYLDHCVESLVKHFDEKFCELKGTIEKSNKEVFFLSQCQERLMKEIESTRSKQQTAIFQWTDGVKSELRCMNILIIQN